MTPVLDDLNLIGHALPAPTCYPVHYSQALDLLRPSEATAILDRSKSSPFLRLWNEILRRNASTSREQKHAEAKASLQEKLLVSINERDRLASRISNLVASTSWRATAPLRAVVDR